MSTTNSPASRSSCSRTRYRGSRVAILWNPNHTDPEYRETQRAAEALRVQLRSLEVREVGDFDAAFQAARRERPEALIVAGSRLLYRYRQRIGDFVARNRLILVGTPQRLTEIGSLLTYGPNPAELNRRCRKLRGPDPQRGQTRGSADAAANHVRAGHQPQGGQGARPDDSS